MIFSNCFRNCVMDYFTPCPVYHKARIIHRLWLYVLKLFLPENCITADSVVRHVELCASGIVGVEI